MKLRIHESGTIVIVLSRRNLRAMLAKLDGHPPRSYCTLIKDDDEGGPRLILIAEDDARHYSGRGYPPGELDPATEEAMQ